MGGFTEKGFGKCSAAAKAGFITAVGAPPFFNRSIASRRRGAERIISPHSRSVAIWSQSHWRSGEERLKALETVMRQSGAVVVRGGDYDAWDLEVRGGLLGNARTALVIEEHGAGRQL